LDSWLTSVAIASTSAIVSLQKIKYRRRAAWTARRIKKSGYPPLFLI